MDYTIELHPTAVKGLKKIDRKMQTRILPVIDSLSKNPRPKGVVKMSGEDNLWRVRVGDYRIVYEIWDSKLVVLVLRIAHRREVYR